MKHQLITIFLFVLCGILSTSPLRADEPSKTLARLAEIEKKEDQILQKLDDIKSQLNVVKIRTSLNT